MSVRVVARIRPLLNSELDKDAIVYAATAAGAGNEPSSQPTIVRIPNPKNEGEDFSFQFNSVYGQEATQQDIFDKEGKQIYYETFHNLASNIAGKCLSSIFH